MSELVSCLGFHHLVVLLNKMNNNFSDLFRNDPCAEDVSKNHQTAFLVDWV